MKDAELIPLSSPSYTEREQRSVLASLAAGRGVGNGPVGKRVAKELARMTAAADCLLTPSCTHAMELALMVFGVGPGDEVIVPSFTFVSTANAVAVRGATPVFCDVDDATLNIDARDLARRITSRTRGVIPVHYAGVPADMAAVGRVAEQHGLFVLEDAAQALGSTHHGRACGAIGDAGAFSFHETKNVSCGEGGALLFRDRRLARKAEIMQEKGTNRSAFLRGEISRYTWVDTGSSYLLSDFQAAILEAQLQRRASMQAARRRIWNAYASRLADLAREGCLRLPAVPEGCAGNQHIFYLRLPDEASRDGFIGFLRSRGIGAAFHFLPLHRSPYARARLAPSGPLPVTERAAATLVRLPLFCDMSEEQVDRVVDAVREAVGAEGRLRKAG